MKGSLLPLIELLHPNLVRLVYSAYLRGEAIENISQRMAMDHNVFLDPDEINHIIDQMNDLYL